MESNFIKERVVVREQLIKKNLEPNKRTSIEPGPSTSKDVIENLPERVIVFEEAVNDRLKQDLVDVSQQVNSVCQTIADYLKIKSALKILKNNPRDVRIQTNIGCNFYSQCHIDDASKVYICVGKDYFLHMELEEALKMVEFKEKQWSRHLDMLQEKASKINAYVKIALEAMGRLYEVEREKLYEMGSTD